MPRPGSKAPGAVATAAAGFRSGPSENLDRDDEADDDEGREAAQHRRKIALHGLAQRLAEPVERARHKEEPSAARQRRKHDEQREVIAEQAAGDRDELIGDRRHTFDKNYQPAPLGVGLLQRIHLCAVAIEVDEPLPERV